jgi:hypothetical protein
MRSSLVGLYAYDVIYVRMVVLYTLYMYKAYHVHAPYPTIGLVGVSNYIMHVYIYANDMYNVIKW